MVQKLAHTIPHQMHKLDKSQAENEAGEAKVATPFSLCLKNYEENVKLIIIIIVIIIIITTIIFSILG